LHQGLKKRFDPKTTGLPIIENRLIFATKFKKINEFKN
jgi:hypothetical protein